MYSTKPGAEGVHFMGAIFLVAGLVLLTYASLYSNWSDSSAAFWALAGMASIGSGLTLLGHPPL